jgi:transcriptional repressor NrdR
MYRRMRKVKSAEDIIRTGHPSNRSLECPICGGVGNQHIANSHFRWNPIAGKMGYRRLRKCMWCGERYVTWEFQYFTTKLFVLKRDGRREEYERAKLSASIQKAYAKHPLTNERLQRVLNGIEQQVNYAYNDWQKREVQSVYLGQLVLASLKELDHIAWMRYAAIFHDFYDLGQFQTAINMLANPDA